MAAGKYTFVIEQGSTFALEVQYKDPSNNPIDLSGCAARMQLRPSAASSVTYLCLTSSLQLDGTGINLSGSNGITPPTSGTLGIYISAATSSLLSFDQAYYDLEIENPYGQVTRLIEGGVKLSKEVTRGIC